MRPSGGQRPGAGSRLGPPRPARPGLSPDHRKDPRQRLTSAVVLMDEKSFMSLVKTEEAHRLARELAALTGESVMAVVTEALRERLDRVRRERNGSLADRLLAIGKD